MIHKRHVLALLLAGVCAGCGSSVTPPPQADTAAAASTSPSAAPSPSPSPSLSPSASPSATPSATPTPTPTPAPTPPPWKTYVSKIWHYSMQYPPDWVVTPGSARLSDQYDAYGYPYVYVDRDTVSGTVSVSLTVTHDIAYNKSHYKAKLKSNKAISLHGYSGRILVFEGIDNGLKVRIERIIIARGKVGYFLSLYADRVTAAADHATFKKLYQSWKPT